MYALLTPSLWSVGGERTLASVKMYKQDTVFRYTVYVTDTVILYRGPFNAGKKHRLGFTRKIHYNGCP